MGAASYRVQLTHKRQQYACAERKAGKLRKREADKRSAAARAAAARTRSAVVSEQRLR